MLTRLIIPLLKTYAPIVIATMLSIGIMRMVIDTFVSDVIAYG